MQCLARIPTLRMHTSLLESSADAISRIYGTNKQTNTLTDILLLYRWRMHIIRICLIVLQLVILKNGQYGDMISVINDFDTHPNFHYNSNHDASKNTVYQVPFHSTFPISIVFLQQRKVTCLLIFPFAFYSEIFYTSGFTTTHVVVSVRHPITY